MRLFLATIFFIAYFSLISNSEIVGQSYLYADDSYELKLIDRIVAIVNNDVITLLELKDALAPYVAKVEASDYTSDKKKEIVNQLTQDMLSRMIERKLTDQEAKRVKITVSDREVDEAIERLKQSQLMSQDDLEKALKDDGLSFLEYREKIREEILRPKLINYTIKSKVVITDKDIKDYYEKNNQTFSGKRRYFLRNILKKDRDSADLIKKRLDGGEDFKAVAAAASEAPNADEEGELGFFDWETLSDTIKDAIENLKSGDHTDVISTDQGYQIFYVETIDDNQNLAPLDAEVSEAISKKLYNEIVEKKFREWLDDLKKKSHIKLML
ncbi:MAG: SurA N-terminal domain-containing protein [Desulfamplus sp.]|nr:SurA N-terminal domain-containing protein [Desulfamplus sp.]MBF0241463.1 SurA N-terminal domain-containing protein [Desulfamplus sp.]